MTTDPTDQLNLNQALDHARRWAIEAGELLLKRQASGFKIGKKGRVNLVTEADLESEQLIVTRISETYPGHQILAEERGEQGDRSSCKWIIDPLDGTTNYAHGYPFYAVSIALEVEHEVKLGVVHDPVAQESFSAIKGGGATLNGKSISVSSEDELGNSLLVSGFSYADDEIRKNLRLFNRVMLTARSVRRDGSAALDLCYVACGRYEGFWELSLHSWDVAAGGLILTEAGGTVSHFNGSTASVYDREILATNGRIHRSLSLLLLSGNSADPKL